MIDVVTGVRFACECTQAGVVNGGVDGAKGRDGLRYAALDAGGVPGIGTDRQQPLGIGRLQGFCLVQTGIQNSDGVALGQEPFGDVIPDAMVGADDDVCQERNLLFVHTCICGPVTRPLLEMLLTGAVGPLGGGCPLQNDPPGRRRKRPTSIRCEYPRKPAVPLPVRRASGPPSSGCRRAI